MKIGEFLIHGERSADFIRRLTLDHVRNARVEKESAESFLLVAAKNNKVVENTQICKGNVLLAAEVEKRLDIEKVGGLVV